LVGGAGSNEVVGANLKAEPRAKTNGTQIVERESGMKVVEFTETPNPNAVKCVLDARISDRARSYFNAQAAAGDDLARRLFEVPGVTNVLILGDWITVGKDPAVAWSTLKPKIRKAIEGAGV
jgi:hypothetical protein